MGYEKLERGDRIRTAKGQTGKVISVVGGFAQIQLDSSLRRKVAVTSLTKIRDEDNGVPPSLIRGSRGTATASKIQAQGEKAGVRALVVEDDPVAAKLVEALMGECGVKFDSVVVSTLADASKALRDKPFNVILLDLNLPDSSGVDTVRSIVAQTDKPIVVMTGPDEDRIAESALGSGAHSVVQKATLTIRSLIGAIRQAVHSEREKTLPEQRMLIRVNRLCKELSEDLGKVNAVIADLEAKRLRPDQHDAVDSLRLTVGRMSHRLERFSR